MIHQAIERPPGCIPIKFTRHLNGITLLVFLLMQLMPNVLAHPFIFHEISSIVPNIFNSHGSLRHPVSGLSFFLQHPLFFSYDFPVMALALIWPFLTLSQPPRSRFLIQPLLACVGIIAGYLVELLTYHLRVLHGKWPADWLEGFAFHACFCFWTLVSAIVALTLGSIIAPLICKQNAT